MTDPFEDRSPLEHRFRGEHPVQTLMYLYRGERSKLLRGVLYYVIKHSPVWLMPLLTANVIDIIAQPAQHTTSELWLNALILAVLLFQNVTYGLSSVSDEVITAALRDADAWEFVERLPDGIETRVGEKGARLSGGQKQRLAIARALIRNPRVLILDEATSALDTETEALIQEALERLMKGRTTFVVAHRLSTIRHAGRIVVLDQGRIVEVGDHTELMAQQGLYACLNELQAS